PSAQGAAIGERLGGVHLAQSKETLSVSTFSVSSSKVGLVPSTRQRDLTSCSPDNWRWSFMRMPKLLVALAGLAGLLGHGGSTARADVKPHALFSDNMVLQRDLQVPVWGTADEGEKVTVRLQNQE